MYDKWNSNIEGQYQENGWIPIIFHLVWLHREKRTPWPDHPQHQAFYLDHSKPFSLQLTVNRQNSFRKDLKIWFLTFFESLIFDFMNDYYTLSEIYSPILMKIGKKPFLGAFESFLEVSRWRNFFWGFGEFLIFFLILEK